MELLPLETLICVSFNLEPYALSVCKKYHNIYCDDTWYRGYLEHNHPDINLWKHNSWKHVYAKSLKMGYIHRMIDDHNIQNLKQQGIMAAGILGSNRNLILTFNGDLYITSNQSHYLIDTKVRKLFFINNYS